MLSVLSTVACHSATVKFCMGCLYYLEYFTLSVSMPANALFSACVCKAMTVKMSEL